MYFINVSLSEDKWEDLFQYSSVCTVNYAAVYAYASHCIAESRPKEGTISLTMSKILIALSRANIIKNESFP